MNIFRLCFNRLLIIISILFVQINCSGNVAKQPLAVEGEVTVLTPPYFIQLEHSVKQNGSAKLSEIATEISYIPLETSSAFLLKRVYEHLFLNNSVLVSDFSNLYHFDQQGNFLQKIGNKGMGPADYNYVQALVKNNSSTLFYLFTAGKINQYDEDGRFIKSVKIKEPDLFLFSGVSSLDDNLWMYLGAHYKLIGDTTTIYSFVKLDNEGNTIDRIVNSSPVESTFNGMILNSIPFYKYKDNIRFMDYGNDTLFTISAEEKILPYAICPLGSMKREINTAGYNPKQMEGLSSKLLVENICEDDTFLYITLQWGVSEEYQYILFNKMTGDIKNLGKKGLINDIDSGISFFPQFVKEDGSKGMWISAEELLEKLEEIEPETVSESSKRKYLDMKKMAANVSPDDNPVLILVK